MLHIQYIASLPHDVVSLELLTDMEHSHCPSAAPHRRKEEVCGFVLKDCNSSFRQSSFTHTKQMEQQETANNVRLW